MAALRQMAGVTRVNGIENPTATTDSYGTPEHSITCVVEGAADADIANTIYLNKTPGCYTNGTTTVTVTDADTGNTMPIRFSRPSYVPIYVAVQVHPLAGWTSGVPDQMKAAIANYLNALQIGQTVVGSELEYAGMTVRPDPYTPMFSIRGITFGTAATPTEDDDVTLTYSQVAQGDIAKISISTV